MHPVGSYCTDISRCAVNKTLNIKISSIVYHVLTSSCCAVVTLP